MLPEVGGLEWLIIAVVALIVVGPKDLPVMMRRLGEFVAKLRNMASEFRSSFDEMARQSELDDLRKEVEAMRKGQFHDVAAQTFDLDTNTTIRDIEQSMAEVGVDLNPPPYQYQPPAETPPLQISEAPAKPARKPRAKAPATKAPDAKAAGKTPAPKVAAKKVVNGSGAAKPVAAKPAATKPKAAAKPKPAAAPEPAAQPLAARKPRTKKTAGAAS